MDLGLKGKVVIVTGGASGIGAGTVEGFVEEGANVVIADINLDAAQKLAEKIGKGEVKVLAVKTDVTKKSDVDNLVSTTLKEFGKIDILDNNAGLFPRVKFVDMEEEKWDFIINLNLRSVYLVTRAVVPHMIAARYGKIVNISSIAGKFGFARMTHYNAAKFGVIGFTQALAKELGEYNINVNAVCPGFVRTEAQEIFIDSATELSRDQISKRDEVFKSFYEMAALKRPQSPKDMANAVLFLSSEVSRNMTGQAIVVDGGFVMS